MSNTQSAHVCTDAFGGEFGGYIADSSQDGIVCLAALIVSPPETEFIGVWGPDTHPFSPLMDGMACTHAMAAAGSETAHRVLAMHVGGHNDWYLPTRLEFLTLYQHCKHLFSQQWYLTCQQGAQRTPWMQGFGRGSQVEGSYTAEQSVRAIRRVQHIDFKTVMDGVTA